MTNPQYLILETPQAMNHTKHNNQTHQGMEKAKS